MSKYLNKDTTLNFEAISKDFTRDEFLEEICQSLGGVFNTGKDCPDANDLECFKVDEKYEGTEIKCIPPAFNGCSCRRCWNQATKDIKFKDEQ